MLLTRTLEYTPPGAAAPSRIEVTIGAPEPDPLPGGDCRVHVEIAGFAEPYARHFFGVDPIQALLLALGTVPDVIASLAGPGARVTWLGAEDLGFRYSTPCD